MPSQCTGTRNQAIVEPSISVIERRKGVPSGTAHWGTMALPLGSIAVGSDSPPSLGGLPEPQVGKNLFAEGPISPIDDQIDTKKC